MSGSPNGSVPRAGSVPDAGARAHTETAGTGPDRDDGASASEASASPGKAQTGSGKGQAKSRWFSPSVVNAKLIYAGYLASLAMPFLAILAALFAHQSAKQDPPAWLATHYTYQIRTFWIGLIANIIAWALAFVGIGLLLFPLIAVWVVARSVRGLINLARREPIEDPQSFFV
ncbi:MAG: hypothetical protein AAGF49_02620 [Pseudomonadota bacterium]